MAQVPYTPVPTVQPGPAGTPRIHIATPGVAFGETIGRAIEGLGHVTAQAGNELFSRAVAMQHLQNETVARETTTNAMVELGNLNADYLSQRGQNAVQGQRGFNQSVQDIVKKHRESLTNPDAQKQFDAESAAAVRQSIMHGASHAATEQKQWVAKTNTAQIQALQDSARYTLHDEPAFQEQLTNIEKTTLKNADLEGAPIDSDKARQDVFKAKSAAYATRIAEMSKENPPKAVAMFKDAVEKHLLHGTDYDRTLGIVRTENRNTGSRVAADQAIRESKDGQAFFSARGNARVEGLHPEFSNRLQSAIQDAEKATGSRAEIDSLKRTTAEQAEIYARHQRMPGGVFMHPAAPPGTSRHELGQAADIKSGPVLDWLHQHAEEYGLEFLKGGTGRRDPGHIQLSTQQPKEGLGKPRPESEESVAKRARGIAEKVDPQDAVAHDMAEARARQQFNAAKQYDHEQLTQNLNTIDGAILSGTPDGKQITTLEQLRATGPRASSAFDNLDETHKKKVIESLGKARAVKDDLDVYDKLNGMHRDSPEEFAGLRVMDVKGLSDASKKHFMNLQSKMKASAEDDPRISAVLRDGEIMQSLKDIGADVKGDTRNLFIGRLQRQLELMQHEKGVPIKPKEMREIAKQTLQGMPGSGWFGSNWGMSPRFQVESPEEEVAKIMKDPDLIKEMGGIGPSKEQAQHLYSIKKFKELYGGTAKKGKQQEAELGL